MTTTIDMNRMYKIRELPLIINCGKDTAYSLVKSGVIKSRRHGRWVRVPGTAIAEFMGIEDSVGGCDVHPRRG